MVARNSRRRFGWAIILAWSIGMTLSAAAAEPVERLKYALAIHGGAGLEPAGLTAAQAEEHRAVLRTALGVGQKILAGGGTALDAVEQTVRALEDDPLYNAGKGAVFNSAGTHELDASIMDGKTGQAGAVAGVTTIKNPISLARLVMTETKHVLLIGAGAEAFADEQRANAKIERVSNSYFTTKARREDWQRALEKARQQQPQQPNRGTVGCVALDNQGNLAAATSTGGMTNKKFGRVGDSPIIGAGTFADQECAVSCTGTGEYFIRASAAFRVAALLEYKGLNLEQAASEVIEKVLPADTGGLIAVDRAGRISMPYNTAGMARAATDSTGRMTVMLGKD